MIAPPPVILLPLSFFWSRHFLAARVPLSHATPFLARRHSLVLRHSRAGGNPVISFPRLVLRSFSEGKRRDLNRPVGTLTPDANPWEMGWDFRFLFPSPYGRGYPLSPSSQRKRWGPESPLCTVLFAAVNSNHTDDYPATESPFLPQSSSCPPDKSPCIGPPACLRVRRKKPHWFFGDAEIPASLHIGR